MITLSEPIGVHTSATVEVTSLRSATSIAATYRVPTARRGVIVLGPMTMTRYDLFRLAKRASTVAGTAHATITPATFAIPFPTLNSGPLGVQLRAAAARLGPGEFHALRDYVEGDELKSIHWKASARSDELKVRQHELQRLRRCTVLLDIAEASYVDSPDRHESFERAVSIAASVVKAAHNAEMNTRFAAGSAIDLRGPDVGPDALRALARVEMVAGDPLPSSFGHSGDGIGVVIVITSTTASHLWSQVTAVRDPTMTALAVSTDAGVGAWNVVPARSINEFRTAWTGLTGSRTTFASSRAAATAGATTGAMPGAVPGEI